MTAPLTRRRATPSPEPHAHPLRMPRFTSPRLAHVRRVTDREHPCWLCHGTIPTGSACLSLRVPKPHHRSEAHPGSMRAYVCSGCLANRGGPNLRRQVARGWYTDGTGLLVLPAWIDPADPFAEEASP